MDKKTIGGILVAVGVGALTYLYIGYYRAKQKGIEEALQETKK